MNDIKSICVFCGSSPGALPEYTHAARELGRLLAEQEIRLVYGGSSIGLMRVLADSCLGAGGRVTGIMPHNLIEMEVAYRNLTEFYVVETMSERKEMMGRLSDAFIAMPGGVGTLDEIFEVMSWNQLGIMNKPLALLNVEGYYDHLIRFLDYTVNQKFVRPEHRNNLVVSDDPAKVIAGIRSHINQKTDSKWIDDLKSATARRL